MNELADIVADGLGAYRGARLLTADTIAEPLRQWLFRRWPPPGWLLDQGERPVMPLFLRPAPDTWKRGIWDKQRKQVWTPDEAEQYGLDRHIAQQFHAPRGCTLGEGLRCLWCVSVWWAIALSIVRHPRLLLHPFRLASRVLAVAGVAALVIDRVHRLPHQH